MKSSQIIAMLNEDLRGEHSAIIQYLLHAYALGEGEAAGEIEAIAREEMRHLKWLAEMIVELGGEPSMGRAPVDTAGESPAGWMARDVAAEEKAIALYREHIAAIADPRVTLLLERIVHDEEVHKGAFADLSAELAAEARPPAGAIRPQDATAEPSRPLEMLLQGVQHEYTVVLQYLYHAFMTPHCPVGDELEWQAVNEMQHMGWFAEEMASRGAYPAMEHGCIDRSQDTAAMLEADIAAERAVTRVYNEQIEELQTLEPELVELVSRVRDHEVYHDALFNQMLTEVAAETAAEESPAPPPAAAPPAPHWTVGQLHGKKQD